MVGPEARPVKIKTDMSFSQYYQVIFVLIGSIKLKIFGTFKVCFLKHFSNHVYDSPLSVDSEIDLFFFTNLN